MSVDADGLDRGEALADLSLLAPVARQREQRCALGVCDGSGFLIDEQTNTASDCRCRGARIAGARTRSLAGRIPRRYQGVSFDRPPVSDLARSAPDQVASVRRYDSYGGKSGSGFLVLRPVGRSFCAPTEGSPCPPRISRHSRN